MLFLFTFKCHSKSWFLRQRLIWRTFTALLCSIKDTFKFYVMSWYVRMYHSILTPICICDLLISLLTRNRKSELTATTSVTHLKLSTVDLYLKDRKTTFITAICFLFSARISYRIFFFLTLQASKYSELCDSLIVLKFFMLISFFIIYCFLIKWKYLFSNCIVIPHEGILIRYNRTGKVRIT